MDSINRLPLEIFPSFCDVELHINISSLFISKLYVTWMHISVNLNMCEPCLNNPRLQQFTVHTCIIIFCIQNKCTIIFTKMYSNISNGQFSPLEV